MNPSNHPHVPVGILYVMDVLFSNDNDVLLTLASIRGVTLSSATRGTGVVGGGLAETVRPTQHMNAKKMYIHNERILMILYVMLKSTVLRNTFGKKTC